MSSLLLFVIALTIFTNLISTLGASAINAILWNLYTRLPTPLHKLVATNNTLRRECIAIQKELRGISSQDEFARWAKIRRQLDKKTAELEKTKTQLAALRATFDARAGKLSWLLTTGLRMFILFWFSKKPVFWMPVGAVPSYVEWGLAFPKAPTGSVSIQVWSFAVGQVITLVFAVVGWVATMWMEKKGPKVEEAETTGEKVPMQGRS